ncbi:restriction endonuclease subunit S [Loigolactobacillus rennini]|uniref:restriction endonuclease subunit S n=1 Tax=Loigolactobacillus rennini TaxID=238013 RepID=UPI00070FC67D|nr:restriction endonuclease subunit S [Loigolactobacillus rennini]
MRVKLRDCAQLIKSRVGIEEANTTNYVSTDNMLPNRGGIKFGKDNLPKAKTVNYYQKGDILMSNIRPYFKKVWFADRDGTRSSDVLCFRAHNTDVLDEYLYCILQSDHFFKYVVSTSKGTKMPRGDKKAILNYEFDFPSKEEQYRKYSPIMLIEKKIRLNRHINDNLVV